MARSSAPGTPAFRIFTVEKGAKVSITGLTITGGSAGYGGGIENSGSLSVTDCTFSGNTATGAAEDFAESKGGGGIDNFGTLSVTGSTFSANSATASGYDDAHGGGIANSGTASVTGSTFSGNSAADGSSQGYANGGGIDNSGTLSVNNSTFSANSATGGIGGFGGGIGNSGTLSVTNSTFSGNSETSGGQSYGGGIASDGTLAVTDSTFSGNSAIYSSSSGGSGGDGGGIFNSGTLEIANSTLSGNSATGSSNSAGGAIADVGTASIYYVTADDNSAAAGGGIASGISAVGGGQSDVVDSIFQNPQGGNVSVASGGAFDSLGHNLFSDDPAISLQPTDLVNTDPLLGPLANNGGPTLTQALLPGSPAINAGIPVAGIATDQRGTARPLSGATDIGAFQVQPPLTVVSLVRHSIPGQPNVLVLTFNLPLDAAPAESLANYRLVRAADGSVISIRSARYDSASESVTLLPRPRLPLKSDLRADRDRHAALGPDHNRGRLSRWCRPTG